MDTETLRRAIADPAVFAEVLCGSPLWNHQQEILASPARYRVICAGRQSGKSRTLAIAALHQAYTKPGSRVLVVSAGETAAERLLADVAGLATGSPLLRGSVLDELKGSVTLSNASVILSTPASQKQVRGWAVDLLILDEAGFIDPSLWRAALNRAVAITERDGPEHGLAALEPSSAWNGPISGMPHWPTTFEGLAGPPRQPGSWKLPAHWCPPRENGGCFCLVSSM
jgi:AAA domain